jgi:glycosyltransferase involved in cell wall biosynthesis
MRDQTIICIAPRRWDALWKETQAIMSRLAVRNRVLYFEPGRDPEHGVVAEMRRNWPSLRRPVTRKIHENLVVIASPPMFPHGRQHLPRWALRATMPLVMTINAAVLVRSVRRALRALAITDSILWLTDPYQLPLLGKFGEKLACYFNFDEFADIAENRRVSRLLRRLDDELTRRADVVFTTSRAQCQRRQGINPRTHFVPNAVDFELFHRAVTGALAVPGDIAPLPRPIIGFVGWLTHHIDLRLLRRISESFPACSLVLVGPDELTAGADLDALRRQPNVIFLGRKDQAAVPAYLSVFDVALMPYRLSGHVLSAYPAKLHEYLAAGRSIVATALPELRPFEQVVWLAQSDDEFVEQLGQALAGSSADAIEARLAVARQNTWDQRVAEISSIVATLLRREDA